MYHETLFVVGEIMSNTPRNHFTMWLRAMMHIIRKGAMLLLSKFQRMKTHSCACRRSSSIVSLHYGDVIMSAMVAQIISLTVVFSTVYSGEDQRKHKNSASLASGRGINRWPVNSPHKGPVTRKNVSIWWHHHGHVQDDGLIKIKVRAK